MIYSLLAKLTRKKKNFRSKYFFRSYLLNSPSISGVETINLRGIKFELNTSDFVDKYLFVTGEYEPDVTDFILNNLKKGDVFMDIGANIGYFSILASKRVGNSGEIYAYEPNPVTLNRLKRNISINQIENIYVKPFAVSNSRESINFYIPKFKNSGMSSLRGIENSKVVKVNTIILDDRLNQLPKIKLIKLDIEGAEHLAISGMVKLLRRDKPMLLLELTDEFLKEFDSSAFKLLQFLSSFGYRIFNINGNEILDYSNLGKQTNIYCVIDE